jgi:hypothetical protein
MLNVRRPFLKIPFSDFGVVVSSYTVNHEGSQDRPDHCSPCIEGERRRAIDKRTERLPS